MKKDTLQFTPFEDVLKKYSKSKVFRQAYAEEILRLQLATDIKSFRTKKHLTQKDLADQAKMPQSVIARIESGKYSISLGTLSRIAHALGKEVQLGLI